MIGYKLLLPGLIVLLLSGCANKLFPEKKLYQYPEKPGDMAVIYPDGSVHHSDGTTSIDHSLPNEHTNGMPADISGIEQPNPSMTQPNESQPQPSSQNSHENTSAKKDATGRHARHRSDQ